MVEYILVAFAVFIGFCISIGVKKHYDKEGQVICAITCSVVWPVLVIFFVGYGIVLVIERIVKLWRKDTKDET